MLKVFRLTKLLPYRELLTGVSPSLDFLKESFLLEALAL